MIDKICDFLIKQIIDNSSGFQYCIDFEIIEDMFKIELSKDIKNQILNELIFRSEVADAELQQDCFDIVLYTSFIRG